jgi:hypothetical protein
MCEITASVRQMSEQVMRHTAQRGIGARVAISCSMSATRSGVADVARAGNGMDGAW